MKIYMVSLLHRATIIRVRQDETETSLKCLRHEILRLKDQTEMRLRRC